MCIGCVLGFDCCWWWMGWVCREEEREKVGGEALVEFAALKRQKILFWMDVPQAAEDELAETDKPAAERARRAKDREGEPGSKEEEGVAGLRRKVENEIASMGETA